ncbi:MAG: trypsin-like peptidase domain-containing protein [Planctomycetia bacterium]|nr:trypsin-like peptidase domain-containing protein [Planctomycetia bacterium]
MKLLLAIGFCLLGAVSAFAQGTAPNSLFGTLPRAADWPKPPTIHPAVVRIVAPGQGSISYGSGTLVSVNDQYGVVLTNWHVVNEATGPISVHFPDGFYSIGSIQKIDRDWDLAAIAIKKPNAQSVPVANQAPRPGEVLTIAGYGSGEYRAASGRCTQYVAPGTAFPYEMVEVAVSARQGDSGGPIFNSRGELAGVLFGEGHGRTSGSYCGRVKWFLSSVVPNSPDNAQLLAVAPARPPQPVVTQPLVAETKSQARQADTAPAAATRVGTTTIRSVPLPAGAPAATPSVANNPVVAPQSPETQFLGWQDLAGETTGDQIKTVLAAVGVLAIILHGLRWLSTEREAA